MSRHLFVIMILCAVSLSCITSSRYEVKETDKLWAERITKSFLTMHPDSVNYPNETKSRRWNYEQGLILEALYRMWQVNNDNSLLRYIERNLNYYIQDDGKISTYKFNEFQLDNIEQGKIVLLLYNINNINKYKIAADTLRLQIKFQPRTSDGGFWHKKIYPNQMWLDGLYMAEPFYALYSRMFGDSAAFDDIANQFLLIAKHNYDKRTGLYFHGWDASKKERWADSKTGCSRNLWGRSIGWFAMSLVDVMEYFPEHSKKDELLKIFQNLSKNMLKLRDVKTNLWYQILDKPNEKGNYLEASVSAMMVYAYAKGVNCGYLPDEFRKRAEETWNGIIENLVSVDDSGIIHLNHVCSVSGLGGNPYRDGSTTYYLSEPQRTDDFKGYGPFLLAAIELERSKTFINK